MSFQVKEVKVIGKLSKKMQKKMGIEQEEPIYTKFEEHFKGYLYKDEFIIAESKYMNKGANDEGLYAIVETTGLEDYCQSPFKFAMIHDRAKIGQFNSENFVISRYLKTKIPESKEAPLVDLDEHSDDEVFSTPRESPITVQPQMGTHQERLQFGRSLLSTGPPPGFPAADNAISFRTDVQNRSQRTSNVIARLENLQIDLNNPIHAAIRRFFDGIRAGYR